VRAEVVAVGTELLLGEALDTNSAWISGRLAEIGVDVYRHTTVGDNVDRIAAAVREAAGRADAVIVTGGIGPTQDDVTRVAVAGLAGVGLERRPELVAYLERYFAGMGRRMPASNLVQAEIPAGATILEPVGTAAGFAVGVGRAVVFCLPGVPAEMQAMLDRDVLAELRRRGGLATTVSRVVLTAGMAEAAVAEACAPILDRLDAEGAERGEAGGRANPTVAFLASGGETRVRITGRAASREEALALLDPVLAEVVEALGAGVVGVDDEGVEHAIARLLTRLGWSLAVAESITAGAISSRLVRVPGASRWLRGGLVVYTDEAKTRLGGVEPALLAAHGSVAESTAAALAAGASERCAADVGLGVVGVAGPTTQGDRPVGTVCLGLATPRSAGRTRTVRLPARDRVEVQRFAASVALDWLRRRLAEVAVETGAETDAGGV
jgi:nicotinamide-nucleotide amidase